MNVPLGQGAKFRGVASTLKPPADAAGAVLDPAKITESTAGNDHRGQRSGHGAILRGHAAERGGNRPADRPGRGAGARWSRWCACRARRGVGLPELLEALALCALPPDAVPRTAEERGRRGAVEVKADPAGPLVAQVFKTRIDPFVQKLNFIRVFSGTLKKDSTVPVVGVRKGVKLSAVAGSAGRAKRSRATRSGPGGIVAVAEVEDLHTGTCLGELGPAADPVPHADGRPGRHAAEPRRRRQALRGVAGDLREEDPTFHRDLDAQTKEMVITGMSELHLQISASG